MLDYYTHRYRHSSRSDWHQRIVDGQVFLEGSPTAPEAQLVRGQLLAYHRPPWQEPDVPTDFEVVYDDPDLVVVAKPAGLPVLPGGGFLEHTLLWQLQRRYPHATPLPIHRLGRGTSGLLLMARSSQARAYLSQQMRDRKIEKIYRALAQGTDMPDRFTVTHPIGKTDHPVLGHLYVAHAQGQPAHSICQVLRRQQHNTLLEVTIQTGRPHQIRIHLAAAGYPLVGDPLYTVGGIPFTYQPTPTGDLPVPGDCGYYLHAFRLAFTHPAGHSLQFTCPPPAELQ